jgi:hypothetical protein
MPKGKGYPDQFGLNSTMNAAGKKRLSEQPKASRSVPGVEVNTKGSRPSASRTVKGMPSKLK